MFRNIVALFFLLLAFLPILTITFFYGKRLVIRHRMEQSLEQRQLNCVEVNTLIWHEKDKELIIDNSLFDVKSISKTAQGTYIVTGLFDYQEKQLHAMLDKAMQKSKWNVSVFQGIFPFLFSTKVFFILPKLYLETKLPYFIVNEACYSQYIQSPISPPPQTIG